MDDFRDLMTAQMDDAAARFADEDFAALYGGAVVSRVRRRRTVRAASVGGGTMLTAGALALAVTQLPATRAMNPASGDPCVTITPAATPADSQTLAVQTGAETWMYVDAETGDVIVSAQFQEDGTWLVTNASGRTEVAEMDGAGTLEIRDDSIQVTLRITADNTISDAIISLPSGADDTTWGPKTVTSGDCATHTPSPTLSYVVERPSPSASPSPTVAARVEDATSPFQCGYVMDPEARDSAVINVVGWEWVEPADFTPSGVAMGDLATTLPQELGSLDIPVVHVAQAPAWAAWDGSVGVGDPANLDVSSGTGGPATATGLGFVKVLDGVVVGALSPTSQQLHAASWTEGDAIMVVLLNAEEAFLPCQGQGADMQEAQTYVVVGSMLDDPSGVQGEGPYYVWRALDQP